MDADTKLNVQYILLGEKARKHRMPDTNIPDYIEVIGSRNSYHPVRDWIDSKKWDGVDRLPEFLDTVVTTDSLKDLLMTKWALSAVAALYRPEFKAEGVLVFISKQGFGKSTWLRSLVNSADWTKDGVQLNTKDKDSVLAAVGAWICELR